MNLHAAISTSEFLLLARQQKFKTDSTGGICHYMIVTVMLVSNQLQTMIASQLMKSTVLPCIGASSTTATVNLFDCNRDGQGGRAPISCGAR